MLRQIDLVPFWKLRVKPYAPYPVRNDAPTVAVVDFFWVSNERGETDDRQTDLLPKHRRQQTAAGYRGGIHGHVRPDPIPLDHREVRCAAGAKRAARARRRRTPRRNVGHPRQHERGNRACSIRKFRWMDQLRDDEDADLLAGWCHLVSPATTCRRSASRAATTARCRRCRTARERAAPMRGGNRYERRTVAAVLSSQLDPLRREPAPGSAWRHTN